MARRIDVRGLREKHGLSQPELARRLGVSDRSVRRWEIDVVDPSPMAVSHLKRVEAELEEQAARRTSKTGPTRKPVSLLDRKPSTDELQP